MVASLEWQQPLRSGEERDDGEAIGGAKRKDHDPHRALH